MRFSKTQIGISTFAILVAILHVLRPDLTIDTITLALIVVAIIPWLAPLFKSLELPGGWKFEFQDALQRAENKVSEAGLIKPPKERVLEESGESYQYFQRLAEEDPNLALAGLRIEIEKRLVKLGRSKGINQKHIGMRNLLQTLASMGVLTQTESIALMELLQVLNRAVHGEEIDTNTANWAIDVGNGILETLDDLINKNKT